MDEVPPGENKTGQDTLAGWCIGGGTLLGCIAYVWGADSMGAMVSGAASWLVALGYIITRAVAEGARPFPSLACVIGTTLCAPSLGLSAHFAQNSQVYLAFCLAFVGLAIGGGTYFAWRAACPLANRSNGKKG